MAQTLAGALSEPQLFNAGAKQIAMNGSTASQIS
jgi:hypothetical protein